LERPIISRVLGVERIADRTVLLRLQNVFKTRPKPGQFVMVWNGVDEKPMAICSFDRREVAIAVKEVGPFTRSISRLGEGDRLGLRGPHGRPFELLDEPLLVGGGIGCSPLLYLAREFAARGITPRIVLGFGSRDQAIFLDEFRSLGPTAVCTVDGSLGEKGMATENLPDLSRHGCVYACGPEPMLYKVGTASEKQGVRCQLLVERYFKCAIGLCGSCSLGNKLVCRDGPVFFWEELKGTEFGLYRRGPSGLREPL